MAVVDSANQAGAPLFAAALAFSTMFTIIPLLLLLSGVLGWLIADPLQRAALLAQLVSYFPPLANVLEASLDGVVRERGALSIVGLLGLLWAASSLYGALDEVMRRLFPGGGVRGEVSRRVRGVITVLIVVALFVGTVSLSSLWVFLGQLVGGLAIWSYVASMVALAGMVVAVLAVYVLVPTRPPTRRAALVPAVVAGAAIGLLTNLFGLVAPWLIGGLSGFGLVATVFGAFIWLNLSFQILLYGAAWARLRRDREDSLGALAQP
jgi:membrane protein